ncbi:MAG: hypothetical protein R2780_01650 [Crocinitomicaceae bacterium]
MKLYDWDSIFDFGQNEGRSLKEVFGSNNSYISWCFQKVDWFCITDEIFEQLPVVIALRNDKSKEDWLKILTDKHSDKKLKLQEEESYSIGDNQTDQEYHDNEPYMIGDPRYDSAENPWIDVFGEGDEAETAYWNTD